MLHIGENHLCSHKILIPPGDTGKNLEAKATVDNESHDEIYKLRAPIGHQGSIKASDSNLIRCKYSVLDVWETRGKTYVLTSAPTTDGPITCVTYAREYNRLHADGWTWHVSSIASPKGQGRSPFSWTSLFKKATSSTLCFGKPTLGKPNQFKLLCSHT